MSTAPDVIRDIPVRADGARADGAPSDVLPRRALENVRNLSTRFPQAGLRAASLVRVASLDHQADPRGRTHVWLCLENLQVTGSFKVRGALCAAAAARDLGHARLVTASAGNHGAGLAYAVDVLGMEAVVVVPEATPKKKLLAIAGPRVSIVRSPGGYDSAEELARDMARQRGLPFVSPYDDEMVASGNGASLAFEVVAALGRVPERVIAPIGGGGLATGLACALALEAGESPLRSRRVWTAQSRSSPAFARSIESGRAVTALASPGPTLAEGLEGGISAASFSRVASVVAGVTVVPESQIARAMAFLWENLGICVEGSAATSLAPVLAGSLGCAVGGELVVVLTGRNVDDVIFRRVVDGAGPW